MTAPRSTFLLLLVAACFAMTAGPAFAEPVETPPAAPPAGAADEIPEGPPPGAADEAEPVVETMKAAPGRLPDTNGPKIPNVIGRLPHETNQALSAWRIRQEHVVTGRRYVGRVVDQHPDAGTTLAPSEVITLVVGIPTLPSRGHACVPAIEKLTLERGVAALRKMGFDVMLRTAESFDRDKGVVLAQAPRPASVARRGSKVVVVVGKGGLAEPVVVAEPLPAPAEEAMPVPAVVEPPAGPPSMPEGPPPGAEPPVVEEPPMPPAEEPVAPVAPAEEPPTPPMPPAEEPLPPAEEPMPPAEEPLPPAAEPTPPAEEPQPPMPPTEEPPAPVVEEPPAPIPVPVVPPKPKVTLRVPVLLGPATGESYPRAFGSTFKWGKVSGATTYEWELQVEAKDGSWSTVTTETVEGTSFRPKRMEAGRFRWRVRAMADGVEGSWSEYRKLFLY